MRIAYLINQYPKVSHSFIRREILALEKRGVEIMRISLRGWDLELVDEADFLERQRTRYVLRTHAFVLIFAMMRMFAKRPIRFLRAVGTAFKMNRPSLRPLYVHFAYLAEACRIEPWLRTARVEHVHAHFGTNSTEVAMLVKILGGPRFSFTVHGPEEFERATDLSLFEKISHATFVATVSQYGRAQLWRALPTVDWGKIHIIHCGLGEDSFGSSASLETPRQIVCVARLSEEKAHVLLIEAARRLAAQGIDFNLVLVGDGHLRAELEALIAHYNLADRIRITGWLSAKQVRDEILAARALVLPSLAEGLPVVIMEASALSRPTISTYVGGIPELVRPDENGWLIPPGDLESLIGALQACLEASPDQIRRMGEAARKRVLMQHDVNVEAEKLQRLIDAPVSKLPNACSQGSLAQLAFALAAILQSLI